MEEGREVRDLSYDPCRTSTWTNLWPGDLEALAAKDIPTDLLMQYAWKRQHDEDPIVMMARQAGSDRMIPAAGMVYAGKGYFRKDEDGSHSFHWNDEVKAKMEAADREAEMPFLRWLWRRLFR